MIKKILMIGGYMVKITKNKTRKRKAKSKTKVVTARGKRKESIARVSIKKGKGIIRINSIDLNVYSTPHARRIIKEPLIMAPKLSSELDITVNVRGGGVLGQAQAIRNAIAVGLIDYSGDEELKQKFLEKDRFMIVEDSRRVEPKKFGGRGARARRQKSYR